MDKCESVLKIIFYQSIFGKAQQQNGSFAKNIGKAAREMEQQVSVHQLSRVGDKKEMENSRYLLKTAPYTILQKEEL